VTSVKDPLLNKAATALLSGSHAALKTEFQAWSADADTAAWLEPAALFAVLCQRADLLGKNWWLKLTNRHQLTNSQQAFKICIYTYHSQTYYLKTAG
jgi:hypothetical protein